MNAFAKVLTALTFVTATICVVGFIQKNPSLLIATVPLVSGFGIAAAALFSRIRYRKLKLSVKELQDELDAIRSSQIQSAQII